MYSQVMKSLTDNLLFVQTTQIPKGCIKGMEIILLASQSSQKWQKANNGNRFSLILFVHSYSIVRKL